MLDVLFEHFNFRALWTPELIVLLLITAFIYFRIISRWHTYKNGAPVPIKRRIYFVLGLIALYFGWGSPFYIAGHIMISFHMLQMVFTYLMAVPLFLLGIPSWFFEAIIERFKNRFTKTVFKLWHPIIALFFFNGLFSFYHIPIILDTFMRSVYLHSLYQILLFVAATLMWWYIIAPIPSQVQLSYLRRIGYIFANGLLITPACALIIFASVPVYETYTNPETWSTVMEYCLPAGTQIPEGLLSGPDAFAFLEKRMDQQLSGVLMKVMQELIYGTAIGYAFKQWLTKEKQQDGDVTISDVPTGKLSTERT